ncbi:MAG: hypothetical protein WAU91_05215, partial [Desulfatitalea sp.]
VYVVRPPFIGNIFSIKNQNNTQSTLGQEGIPFELSNRVGMLRPAGPRQKYLQYWQLPSGNSPSCLTPPGLFSILPEN